MHKPQIIKQLNFHVSFFSSFSHWAFLKLFMGF
jgi:hypothetical protein